MASPEHAVLLVLLENAKSSPIVSAIRDMSEFPNAVAIRETSAALACYTSLVTPVRTANAVLPAPPSARV